MIVKENELAKLMKNKFYLRTILLELEGVIEGHVSFIRAVCRYNNRNGILYIFELLNNLKINIASQYKIIYDEEKRTLTIYLDNGQIVKLTVLRK